MYYVSLHVNVLRFVEQICLKNKSRARSRAVFLCVNFRVNFLLNSFVVENLEGMKFLEKFL